jgi:uncharacterized coiled-coil protein SlyX
MEDQIDRIERAVAEMRTQMAIGFASVESRFGGVENRLGGVENRLGGVENRLGGLDEQLAAVRQEIRQGDADTRSQLGAQIESVRDDVRIFAEAHVALEQRVTRLEHRSG